MKLLINQMEVSIFHVGISSGSHAPTANFYDTITLTIMT